MLRDRAYDRAAGAVGTGAEEKRTTAGGAKVIETGRPLDAAETRELTEALESRDDVEYAEPDLLLTPVMVPNDTHYNLQWDLYEDLGGMRMPEAWDLSTGEGTVVAVVDTGMTAHSDLDENVLPGYDMMSHPGMSRDGDGRDANPQDEGDWYGWGECGTSDSSTSSWHGTHVAGTIAAVANNGKGVTGIAHHAKVVPVRALGACGGYLSDISDAVIWATGGSVPDVPANPNPADVINLSVGVRSSCTASMQTAVDFAVGRGAAVVVAAGNEDEPAANVMPANCADVITVAASGPGGTLAPYSNFGDAVDVTAPGGDMSAGDEGGIASTVNAGATTPASEDYGYSQGTSMAAPHVAGLAALMVSANPGLTPARIEERLKATAQAWYCSPGCGAGLVDAAAALGALPAVVAATPSIIGAPVVGAELTASAGTWSPAPLTLAWQWNRNGTAIPGATGEAYTPVAADLGSALTVTATGTRDGYRPASATSAATGKVGPGTLWLALPYITGPVMVGSELTVTIGSYSPGATLSYQWYRSGTVIAGATGKAFRPTAAEEGHTLTVRITARQAGYTSLSSESDPTFPVDKGILSYGSPKIGGTLKVGNTLTAYKGTWTAGTSFSYQWLRDGKVIESATGNTYRLTGQDAGKTIRVRITGTLTGYNGDTRVSAATAKVAKGTLTAVTPKITGTARVGRTLTAWKGTWSPGSSFTYRWLRDGQAIKGGTKATYKATAADAGRKLTVKVTGSLDGYTTLAKTSAATATVAKGTLTAVQPKITGTAKVGSTLTARTGTWTYGTTIRYQWYRSGKAVKGATAKTYKVQAADRGDRLKVRVTGAKPGYTTTAKYSAETKRP
ncbi:S8 family serine peptidase [Arthrobacter sp. E918]|uniref:S8 family serine peptidase n=2 Tax=Arthrobacter mobilis TaxID=2724944 RepID=A0A7X6HFA0_9MICC|nr:S8 family serine peptidase [Arthrobacter mobilis]